jgi:hypothetical protein
MENNKIINEADSNDNEFLKDFNDIKSAGAVAQEEPPKDTSTQQPVTSDKPVATTDEPQASSEADDDNEFVSKYKELKPSKSGVTTSQPEAPKATEQPKATEAPKAEEQPKEAPKANDPPKAVEAPKATETPKATTADAIFGKIYKLEAAQKKAALQDLVKIVQTKGAAWAKEIMAKRKMLEEGLDLETAKQYQGFKARSRQTVQNAISKDKKLMSAWPKDPSTQNIIVGYVIQNALKDFDKTKGQTYWPTEKPNAPTKDQPKTDANQEQQPSLAKNAEVQSAQEKPNTEKNFFDKMMGAAKDFKAGYDNPGEVAADLARKASPTKVTKHGGGVVASDTVSSIPQSAGTPSKPQQTQPAAPKAKKVTNPKTKPDQSAAQENPTPSAEPAPKTDEVKNKVLSTLQNDEGGKKLQQGNPKNLEVISSGAASGKKAEDILNDLRAANGGNFDVTDDVKHVIGKALGEVGREQDTSTLKESRLRSVVKESFFMAEAEGNDAMSNDKTPTPGDMVWFISTKLLEAKFKDINSLTEQIRYNKLKVKFVDLNAEEKKSDGVAPLKEHFKSLFYEKDMAATEVEAQPNAETQTNDTETQDQPNPDQEKQDQTDKKPNDADKNKKPPKYFDAANGTAKIEYLEGSEKGKQIIVKLKDLEMTAELGIEIMQFGYYQSNVSGEKAIDVHKKDIAKIIYNAENNQPLDTKVDDAKLTTILAGEKLKSAMNNKVDKLKLSPEAKTKIAEKVKSINELKDANAENAKTMHIQLVNFDNAQKRTICKNIVANKPLTKKFVIDSKKTTNLYADVPTTHVSRVNYAKGLNWFKVGGMTFGILDGILSGTFLTKTLGKLATKLQSMADTWKGLAGSKVSSNF